jgi:hypothetical protein
MVRHRLQHAPSPTLTPAIPPSYAGQIDQLQNPLAIACDVAASKVFIHKTLVVESTTMLENNMAGKYVSNPLMLQKVC